MTDDEFRDHLRQGSTSTAATGRSSESIWESFAPRIEYHRGDFDDPAAWSSLSKRLDRIDRDRGTGRQPALLPGGPAERSTRRS